MQLWNALENESSVWMYFMSLTMDSYVGFVYFY